MSATLARRTASAAAMPAYPFAYQTTTVEARILGSLPNLSDSTKRHSWATRQGSMT